MGHNPDFIGLYTGLNLLNRRVQEVSLHQKCEHRQACWANAVDRFPPEDQGWSSITQPWVGHRYEELRLVVIGENFNECGGFDALVELTGKAKDLIADGWRRVRFGNSFKKYPGSLLWHRIGCYAAAFGEALGVDQPKWGNNGYPDSKDASSAYDLISFVEHIKCSPVGDKSKPTGKMWENCGAHILKKELQLLAPEHILILGTSNNAWAMREKVFDSGWHETTQTGTVTRAKCAIDGKPVTAWVVPHPTSRGDSAGSNIQNLRQALEKNY